MTMESYGRICAEFYDVDKPEAPKDALAFYASYVRDAEGPVLEPMCGTGRFLLPLVQQGFSVAGTDGSSAMLERCRAKALAQGLKIEVHEQLLQALDLGPHFGLAFIPSGSFGLIPDLGVVRTCLRRLHDRLKPGGKLVFEVEKYSPHGAYAGPWGGRWVTRPDGGKLLISWLPQSGENEAVSTSLHRYEIFKDGVLLGTELEKFSIRTYKAEEMIALLSEAGFSDIKLFRAYDFRPPGPSDTDLIFEGTRPS